MTDTRSKEFPEDSRTRQETGGLGKPPAAGVPPGERLRRRGKNEVGPGKPEVRDPHFEELDRLIAQDPPQRKRGHRGERAHTPKVARARGRRRKQSKRHLPSKKTYNHLAALTAGFSQTLRDDPKLQSAIEAHLPAFRFDLLALMRADFHLRRGRHSKPRIDEACHMFDQGKTVPQILRVQIPDWDKRDEYSRYLDEKGLNQALRRRGRPAAGKRRPKTRKAPRKKAAPKCRLNYRAGKPASLTASNVRH